jgi:hypothetical protein
MTLLESLRALPSELLLSFVGVVSRREYRVKNFFGMVHPGWMRAAQIFMRPILSIAPIKLGVRDRFRR